MPSTPRASRANRYPLGLPLRYRPAGEARWLAATTLNVSHTGVLFQARELLPDQAPVQLEIDLPGDEDGRAQVVTGGVVARVAPAPEGTGGEVAVALDGYELVRLPRDER
jgi:hypothetical protein